MQYAAVEHAHSVRCMRNSETLTVMVVRLIGEAILKMWNAYYHLVQLNGNTVALKSREQLSIAGWEALAQQIQIAPPEPEPELICPGWEQCPFRKEPTPIKVNL